MLRELAHRKREGRSICSCRQTICRACGSASLSAPVPPLTHEQKLFPKDSILERHYGEGAEAWKAYLADRWGSGSYEAGSFAFHRARLSAMAADAQQPALHFREAWLWLLLYNGWNITYALVIWRYCHNNQTCKNLLHSL